MRFISFRYGSQRYYVIKRKCEPGFVRYGQNPVNATAIAEEDVGRIVGRIVEDYDPDKIEITKQELTFHDLDA